MINYGFKFYINKGEVIILLCKRLYSKNIYRNNSNTFMRVIYIIAQMCTDVYGYLNSKHNKWRRTQQSKLWLYKWRCFQNITLCESLFSEVTTKQLSINILATQNKENTYISINSCVLKKTKKNNKNTELRMKHENGVKVRWTPFNIRVASRNNKHCICLL